jgi:hypothetical protein
MTAPGDFRDPDWEPDEAEHAALMEDFCRTVLWRQVMATRGIKVLSLRLSPADEHAAMEKWWAEEGHATHEADVSR